MDILKRIALAAGLSLMSESTLAETPQPVTSEVRDAAELSSASDELVEAAVIDPAGGQ